MAQIQSDTKLRGLKDVFDGLSFSQVTAGALAAATSMLLASNVGIAGTVIGVAVSSVVSAVASQVYKKFLIASAEKVKDLAPVGLAYPGAARGEESANESESVSGEQDPTVAFSAETSTLDKRGGSRGISAIRRGRARSASMGEAYADAALLKARIARERKAKIQRNAIIVAVLSAVFAVVVCALTIDVATQGKGLGPQMPTATYIQARNNSASEDEGAVPEEEPVDESAENQDPSKEDDAASGSLEKEEQDASTPSAGSTNSNSSPDKETLPSGGESGSASNPSVEGESGSSSEQAPDTEASGTESPDSESSSHEGSSTANKTPSPSA